MHTVAAIAAERSWWMPHGFNALNLRISARIAIV